MASISDRRDLSWLPPGEYDSDYCIRCHNKISETSSGHVYCCDCCEYCFCLECLAESLPKEYKRTHRQVRCDRLGAGQNVKGIDPNEIYEHDICDWCKWDVEWDDDFNTIETETVNETLFHNKKYKCCSFETVVVSKDGYSDRQTDWDLIAERNGHQKLAIPVYNMSAFSDMLAADIGIDFISARETADEMFVSLGTVANTGSNDEYEPLWDDIYSKRSLKNQSSTITLYPLVTSLAHKITYFPKSTLIYLNAWPVVSTGWTERCDFHVRDVRVMLQFLKAKGVVWPQ